MANFKRHARTAIKIAAVLLVAVAIPILFARCTPKWFPDSQAFAYVTGLGEVHWHSLKTGETKKLRVTAAPLSSVAVWPTGDRLVVAQLNADDAEATLELVIVNLTGEELHRSPKQPLKGKGEKGTAGMMLQLDVSPDGKNIVTFAPGLQMAAVYDVERKKFRTIENAASFGFVSGMIAGSDGDGDAMAVSNDTAAIPPTGKGFLALVQRGGESGVMDFTWFAFDADEPRVIDMPKDVEKLMTESGAGKFSVATIPRWKGAVLSMNLNDRTLEVDTANRTIRLEKNMTADHLHQHAEREKVRVLADLGDGLLVQAKEKELQLWRRDAAVVSLGEMKEGAVTSLAPSPDGKRLLVRTISERDTLRVYDRTGRKLAELDHAGAK